tara:strand:+ start:100 stop:321 length:222 start_codon:yes stop_codon:yes gene_type:complete
MDKLNDNIYIYVILKSGRGQDVAFHDRTVSRYGLGPARAKEVVDNHNKRGVESFYTIGNTFRKLELCGCGIPF